MAQIYISSTYEDLKNHREAVYKTLRQWKHDVIAMENYVASEKRPLDKCLNDVAQCDVYIGLFAWRYGYIPPGEQKSITQLEYECAIANQKKCLIFILPEEASWPRNLMDKNSDLIDTFRKQLQTDHNISFFKSEDDLKAKVAASLQDINLNPYESELKVSYLNWVISESSLISLSGIDPKTAGEKREELNLGSIYIALLTQSTDDHDHFKQEKREPIPALEMLNKHQHMVLLGDPGSGKTTFVNFVTWCLAGEAIQHSYATIERLIAPLPDEDGKESDKKQQWDHGPLVPVRIILRDFVACSQQLNSQNVCADILWQFIENRLKGASLEDYIPLLKRELQEKGGMILLDGLDEVPEANHRRKMMKEIIQQFKTTFHKCRILVTSRTYAYQKQDFLIKGLKEVVLAPFTSGQIRRFVDLWYVHISELKQKSISDAKGRAESLKYAIFHNARIRELADRPLILTLMSSLHAWRGGSLPEKREELYASTVDLLLDWWQQETVIKDENDEYQLIQPSLLEWLNTDRDKVREMIEELAYEAHRKQPELMGTADIAESDLISGIIRVSNNPEVKPIRLIEFLRDRAGLLISRGVEVYTFPHRTFQEYLAACYLARTDYPELVAELATDAPDRWREVVLLAGASYGSKRPFGVWALADELCYEPANKAEGSIQELWGGYLAGQVLSESANLDKVSKKNAQSLQRIKDWHLKIMRGDQLPAIERVNAGNSLFKLGDDRFNKDIYYLPDDSMLGFIEIPGGNFLMGSDDQKDIYVAEYEKPQHTVRLEKFYMAKYPVTVFQYKVYLEKNHIKETEDWYQYNRFGNHPVVRVSWLEAMQYCSWLTKTLKENRNVPKQIQELFQSSNWQIALPSEAEWEKAARGQKGQIYPWGDKFDKDRLNYEESQIGRSSSVGCFEKGVSPYKMEEMSGNVWEWTRSIWGTDWLSFEPDFKYPYKFNDGREALEKKNVARVVRGGGWFDSAKFCRVAFRSGLMPDHRIDFIGFRLCLSLRSSGLSKGKKKKKKKKKKKG